MFSHRRARRSDSSTPYPIGTYTLTHSSHVGNQVTCYGAEGWDNNVFWALTAWTSKDDLDYYNSHVQLVLTMFGHGSREHQGTLREPEFGPICVDPRQSAQEEQLFSTPWQRCSSFLICFTMHVVGFECVLMRSARRCIRSSAPNPRLTCRVRLTSGNAMKRRMATSHWRQARLLSRTTLLIRTGTCKEVFPLTSVNWELWVAICRALAQCASIYGGLHLSMNSPLTLFLIVCGSLRYAKGVRLSPVVLF